MLPFGFAFPQTLTELKNRDIRVVLRVEEGAYNDDAGAAAVVQGAVVARSLCDLDAVIIGCEPDVGVDFGFASPTWAQQAAYAHRRNFDRARLLLQSAGIQVISPGWLMRSISEDEPPQPGRAVWREIMSLPQDLPGGSRSFGYLDADGSGAHIYQYSWTWPVDMLRFKFAVKHASEMWHRPLWIDEANVNTGPPLQRMAACLNMADLLVSPGFDAGSRVVMFCPFVSNGNGVGWDIRYLLRQRECYQMLGNWMQT
jgi:hypothetical protein